MIVMIDVDDFQRKRAFEKGNIRCQLQLHFGAEKIKEDASVIDDGKLSPKIPLLLQFDRNHNIGPDGAVSTPSPRFTDSRARENTLNYSDCGDESDTEAAS